MSAPSLEQKIHFTKGTKVPRVKITKATRSATGFVLVEKPYVGAVCEMLSPCNSKREALQLLLAKIRVLSPKTFEIRRGK